jgi:hypothetical protein
MKKNMFVMLGTVLFSVGAGFYGGYKYAEKKILPAGTVRVFTDAKTEIPNTSEPFAGTIDSVTSGLVVVTTNKGEKRGVGMSSLTRITEIVDVPMDKLVPGTQVIVHGVIQGGVTGTARNIQVVEWSKK